MALSWNGIRARAIQFVKDHENDTDENGQYADFWRDFFDIFGARGRLIRERLWRTYTTLALCLPTY